MMKKKLSALLTALACMASTAGMPVSAVSEGDYVEREEGSLYYVQNASRFYGIMVETDGTELTGDVFEGYEDYYGMQTWEEFTQLNPWGDCVTDIIPDGLAYMAFTYTLDEEAMTAWGRTLMMENPAITNVYLLDYVTYTAAYPTSEYVVRTKDPEVIPDESFLPIPDGYKLEHSEKGMALYAVPDIPWNEAVVEFYTEDGAVDRYAQYLYYCEKADQLLAEHSDILSDVEPLYNIPANGLTSGDCTVQSIWQFAGDCNADGEVNAQDAAEQLIAAANAATGGEIEITGANDINADGAVNALDAAAVLAYAAAQGSGQNLSWVEILG
ncbi:MAG: hypothetical protein IKC40_09280 [Oscillospiraceae bacterium]|nr:hypothetical protein [Oscillospiraceae bacterium]